MKKKKIQSMYQNKDYNEQEVIEDDRGWMDGQTGRQIDRYRMEIQLILARSTVKHKEAILCTEVHALWKFFVQKDKEKEATE